MHNAQIKSGEVEAGLNELLEKVANFFKTIFVAVVGEGGVWRRGKGEGEEEEQEQGVQLQVHRAGEGGKPAGR